MDRNKLDSQTHTTYILSSLFFYRYYSDARAFPRRKLVPNLGQIAEGDGIQGDSDPGNSCPKATILTG